MRDLGFSARSGARRAAKTDGPALRARRQLGGDEIDHLCGPLERPSGVDLGTRAAGMPPGKPFG